MKKRWIAVMCMLVMVGTASFSSFSQAAEESNRIEQPVNLEEGTSVDSEESSSELEETSPQEPGSTSEDEESSKAETELSSENREPLETDTRSEEESEEEKEETASPADPITVNPKADIEYTTHVQTYGWLPMVKNGTVSGTTGKAKRMEAVRIQLSDLEHLTGGVSYQAHVQTYGWTDWKTDGQIAGTVGEAKRLEAIRIKLTGEAADHYDVYYRVHAQTFGWMGWAKNGESAGSSGCAKRLEALQICLIQKGGTAPGSTSGAFAVSTETKGGEIVTREQRFTFTQKRTAAFSLYDTITDDNGNLVIIDGGYAENCNDILDQIRKHGNHVSAWILTHYHDDHVQAFYTLLEHGKLNGVKIDRIYAPDYLKDLLTTFPELKQDETFVLAQKWRKELDSLPQVRFLDEGNEVTLLDGLQMHVYNGWNRGKKLIWDASRRKQLINNAGLMFKLSTTENSILITADVERIMESELVQKYGNSLQADYVQCSHHGICHGMYDQGFSPDFYCNTVKAKQAFIPNRSGMGTMMPLLRALTKRGMPVKLTDGDTSVVLRSYSTTEGSDVPWVFYSTHVQDYGWISEVSNGSSSGTMGQAKRLEGIKIRLANQTASGGIQYRTHVQSYGWQGWVQDGAVSGTTGQAKRLEAIQIRLTGTLAAQYDVYYRAYCQTYGWTGWIKNGQTAGTTGQGKRLEAVEIKIVKK